MKNFAEVRASKAPQWIAKPTILARCETWHSTEFLTGALLKDGFTVQFRVCTVSGRWTPWEEFTAKSEALESRIPHLRLEDKGRTFGQSAG